jgi:von Willebrand factor type A C-terminal domain/von Willebrand factor type A domain
MTTFTAEAYQNEYLPAGGEEVNAVVTVTASDAAPGATSAQAAEIIIVDVSGSMGSPRAKLTAATRATAVAIDCIRDGVMFGVIAGNDTARAVYPQEVRLVAASPQTREDAKQAVAELKATGGTAIGRWLALADELFAATPEAIRHAILLTDGRDEHETPVELEAVLADCEGSFQCDCRGVGTDWEVQELRRIATTLLGTVDIVAEPADLQDDFQAMIERAMGKATGDVSLRLWTPQGASVAFLKQVAPTIEDLTARSSAVDALTADYPTGAWGDESRDYHLCVHVQPRAVGEEMLAGRVGLMVGGETVSQALIRALWTDDEQLSTRINREVAHYTGQAELADAIQEGLEARKQGDEHTATFKLGRAVQLAAAAGNSDTMKLLAGVVDVQEAHTGTVRLKPRVQEADEMALDTRSTKTVRVKKPGS